jgi:hypothetical protein
MMENQDGCLSFVWMKFPCHPRSRNVPPSLRHVLCKDCLNLYVASRLNEHELDASVFPIRCCIPDCKALLPRDVLFALLKENEVDGEDVVSMIEEVELKASMITIEKSSRDAVIYCPKCSYFETFDLNHLRVPKFFICKACVEPVTVCIKCKKYVEYSAVSKHTCSQGFEFWKTRIESALVEASARKCPGCGKGGRLDDNCTHVSCSCGTRWCYCCQKKSDDFKEGFSQHNNLSSDTNQPGKCPLFLKYKYGKSISAEEALSRFHEELTKEALEKVRKELNDPEMWSRLKQTFHL